MSYSCVATAHDEYGRTYPEGPIRSGWDPRTAHNQHAILSSLARYGTQPSSGCPIPGQPFGLSTV